MGQIQRTNAVTGALSTIATGKALRTLNPHEITFVNPDSADHIVDLFDSASPAAVIFTLPVARGGLAFHLEPEQVGAISSKMSVGGSLQAKTREAIVVNNVESVVDFGRL